MKLRDRRTWAALLIVAGGVAAAGSPPTLITLDNVSGTVALYQFEEVTGTTTADDAGTHDGTFSGSTAPLWTSGQDPTRGGLSFTPASSVMYISDYSIPVGTTWTIQAVVNFPVASNATGFNVLAGWGYYAGSHVALKSGELGSMAEGPGDFKGCGYNVSGLTGWHLLSAVGSEGTTTFYIDGAAVGTALGQETSDVWAIGGINADSPWGGSIDALRIMNVPRSAEDIAGDAFVLPPVPPPAPQELGQFDADGAVLAPGGSIRGSFSVQATVESGSAGDVRLEVEVKPVGVPFDGSTGLTQGEDVAPGSVATVVIAGLPVGSYRWQVRSVDDGIDLSSDWVGFGTDPDAADVIFENDSPVAIATAIQLDAATGLPTPPGHRVDDISGLRIEVQGADPDLDRYRLVVEVVRFGESFSGLPTAESALVDSGEVASLTTILPVGRYCWRYQLVDSLDGASAWTAAGDGSSPDVVVGWAGSRNVVSGGCVGAAGGMGLSGWACLVLGVGLLGPGRIRR